MNQMTISENWQTTLCYFLIVNNWDHEGGRAAPDIVNGLHDVIGSINQFQLIIIVLKLSIHSGWIYDIISWHHDVISVKSFPHTGHAHSRALHTPYTYTHRWLTIIKLVSVRTIGNMNGTRAYEHPNSKKAYSIMVTQYIFYQIDSDIEGH